MSDTVKKRGRPAMSGTPQTTAERAAAYRARLKAQAAEGIAKDEMIRQLLLRIADLEQQLHKATTTAHDLVSNTKETTPPLQYAGKAYGLCQCVTAKGSRCKSAKKYLIQVQTPDGIAELAACTYHFNQWRRGEEVQIIASPL